MKINKHTYLTLALLPFSLSQIAYAAQENINFDQSKGSTEFHAVGRPSAIKINGTGSSPKGAIAWGSDGKASGTLLLDLSSLDTGISMRTNHMKEKYLEVEKYPQAKLTLTEVALPSKDFGTDFTESDVSFKGTLTLHGITKPVTGTFKLEQQGATAKVHAEFSIKITDYQISVPVFAGITVADDVSLVVEATAPFIKQ